MAMLSMAAPPKPGHAPLLPSASGHKMLLFRCLAPPRRPVVRRRSCVSTSKMPTPPPYPPPPGEKVYQPFRPPPSPLPSKYRSLDTLERIDILRDRLGIWYEFAPLLPALADDGFTPASIEELTGIPGAEQNRLIVAARVRDSLVSSPDLFDPELLQYFDSIGGADLLYELRFLNAEQRAAAAHLLINRRFDPMAAQELARAMKDFPRRRGDYGWDRFSADSPADCLAYTYFRLSRETLNPDERVAWLKRAVESAETEEATKRIEEEMERASAGAEPGEEEEEEEELRRTVPVVRLRYGEVAEASTVALLPVCRAGEGEEGMAAAPGRCKAEGELGVVTAEQGWDRWVVLPGWQPVMAAAAGGGGVAVEFVDGRVLPWRGSGGWEEAVLVVTDRERREVAEENGYYVVGGEGKGLAVERGRKLLERGVKEALGTAVLVLRPPTEEEDDILSDEDWE